MGSYKIYFAGGDRLRTTSGQDTFTAAEAADHVAIHPWAWVDADDDVIVGNYRPQGGKGQRRAIKGSQMAVILRNCS
jgi:hypothetical protein